MNNQKNKNEKDNKSVVDLSRFPIGQGEKSTPPKSSWVKIGNRNRVFTIIIIVSFILIIILLSSLFNKRGGATPPGEYTPPAGYRLFPGEKYTPPFP